MRKRFVTFYSPGTFVSEETTKHIDKWDIDKAVEMSQEITERHAAKPYGFRFTTRERADDELDSKVREKSNMYYLGGDVFTLEEIKAKNDPSDRILISNMECNHWDKIVVNTNSWRFTAPLMDGDVVLSC